MKSWDDTCMMALKEMFKRVGEKYPNPELTKHNDWYMRRNWTEEQEADFKKWLKKLIKKRHSYITKQKLECEASMFLLMWGWTNRGATDGKTKKKQKGKN